MIVDLGCGGAKRGEVGIDLYPYPGVDIICHLGFEEIPLEVDSVDKVMAYDFLEHVPAVVHYREGRKWRVRYPRIALLKEIHRILKPGGVFESNTPSEVTRAWAQDPTHTAPPWTDETWNYYLGGYGCGVPNHSYGLDYHFEKVLIEQRGAYLFVQVRKPLK